MKAYILLFPLLLVACNKNSPSPAIISPPDSTIEPVQLPVAPTYPYTRSYTGMMVSCIFNFLPDPTFYDTQSVYVFYGTYINPDSIFVASSGTIDFGTRLPGGYAISGGKNLNKPNSGIAWQVTLVGDSLLVGWDNYTKDGYFSGIFKGKVNKPPR